MALFQLVMTGAVPAALRPRAEKTIECLRLQNDVRIIRLRKKWYELYDQGKLSLDGLEELAPLLAQAVIEHDAKRGRPALPVNPRS
jgi:hypothetical protein